MKKTTVILATEREILEIINEHFGCTEDSIVALEELGNEVWCVSVKEEMLFDEDLNSILGGDYQFKVTDMLDILCSAGKLESGEYQIDCTW
jgi:hypothetical protein